MKKTTFFILILMSFNSLFSQVYIQVTTMNSTVELPQGKLKEITWNSFGVNNVKIEYATSYNIDFEKPNEWNTITESTLANTGKYQWSLPNEVISSARIRITSVENSSVSDINDMDFSTYDAVNNPKALKIVYPNGGEIFDTVGILQNIIFKTLNDYSEGVLEFSSDAGQTWVDMKENLYFNGNPLPVVYNFYGTMLTWRIPNINSTQCKIRIKNKADNSIIDESDNVFTIQPNASRIEVISLNSAVELPQGEMTEINWNSFGVNNVKIEYATSYNLDFENPNVWNTIIASTPANTGSYEWIVPDEITSVTRVRITSVENDAISDINDSHFSTYDAINSPKKLKIVYPNGGEIFDTVGILQNIIFKTLNDYSEGVLEFSSDAGQTWVDIKENLYHNGNPYPSVYNHFGTMFTWRIPNINSTQCKIRIKNKADNSIIDESDDVFTIQPNASKIEVTSLNDLSTSVFKGQAEVITWNSNGVNNVKIEYATSFNLDFENPNVWNTIIASTPANIGSYQWNVPDEIISGARVRITSVENNAISDINDANFQSTNKPDETVYDGEDCSKAGLGFIDSFENDEAPSALNYWGNSGSDPSFSYTRTGTALNIEVDHAIGASIWSPMGIDVNFGDNLSPKYLDATNNPVVSVSMTNQESEDVDVYFTFLSDGMLGNDARTVTAEYNGVISLFGGTIAGNSTVNWDFDLSKAYHRVWVENEKTCLDLGGTYISGSDCVLDKDFDLSAISGVEFSVNANNVGLSGHTVLLNRIQVGATCQPGEGMDASEDPNRKALKIVYPNGGESFLAQENFQNITFKYLNTTSQVVLEFSSDAGQTWSPLDKVYYNGNLSNVVYPYYKGCTWTIPNINSTQCKLRIKDKANNSIIDESDNFFTISGANTSSANQSYKNDFVKLYPNPCKNNLNIETNEVVDSYRLYSLNGRLIQQNSVNRKKFSIKVEHLGKGTYLLFIKNDKKQFFKKIVKD